MRDSKDSFQSQVMKFSYLALCGLLAMLWGANANAQNQTDKVKSVKARTEEVQLLYREYRGVRLGMTAEEARAKLGDPVLKGDDQDFYVFSPNETAQIAYNAAHKVIIISTDYTGGVGAPDYKTVVGADLQERPDGSMYKMVHHEKEGFWVSYNKSAGVVPVVTVTLQVLLK